MLDALLNESLFMDLDQARALNHGLTFIRGPRAPMLLSPCRMILRCKTLDGSDPNRIECRRRTVAMAEL
jgi:hypothetical protein